MHRIDSPLVFLPFLRSTVTRRLKVNFALLSAMAAGRLSNGDNQLIEDMSRKVRSRSAMRVEKELKARMERWVGGSWCVELVIGKR